MAKQRDSLTDKAHSDHRGPIRAAMETTIDQLQVRASLAVEGIEDYVERRERADEQALDLDDMPGLLDELYRGPIAQPGQDFTETTGIRLQARDMSGMSYIEIVKWENEYRSEEQITMARTEIFS